ncbi:DoxX-like family protein [Kitasatospora sp. CM 4170]|uniref:DoxX-like family protein n=1 Tax=Kitasatospora aburaviensis TaxID=67265 RepID=A0ABW1EX13_9ACTN|nr:DoxX-like family protein [Kitasatospora sp. CM 4170]WNM43721.1 DoxX-like family protein [Kitasatospora sp. CM 4170]
MPTPWQTRCATLAVALMWGYEGLWCKIFPGRADQRAIVEGLPLLPDAAAHALLIGIGLAELALGAWVLSGYAPRVAALVQTALVLAFNTGGLLVGADQIPEPGRLVVQDLVFLALVWTVATAHRAPADDRTATNGRTADTARTEAAAV